MAPTAENFVSVPPLGGVWLPSAPTMYDAYQVLFPRYFRRVMRVPNANHYWPPWQLGMQTSWDTSAAPSSVRAASVEVVLDACHSRHLEDSLPPLKRQRCGLSSGRNASDAPATPRVLAGPLGLTPSDFPPFCGGWEPGRPYGVLSFQAEERQKNEDVQEPVVVEPEQEEEDGAEEQDAEVLLAATEASPYTCPSEGLEGLDQTAGCVKGTWCGGVPPFDSQSLETTAAGSSGQAPSAGSAFISGCLCYTHALCSSPTANSYALENSCGDPCGFRGVSGGSVEGASNGVVSSMWSHCHETGRTTGASALNSLRVHPETYSSAVDHVSPLRREGCLDNLPLLMTRKSDKHEALNAESVLSTSLKTTTEKGIHMRGHSETYGAHVPGLGMCGNPRSVDLEPTEAQSVRRKSAEAAAPVPFLRLTAEVLRQLARQYETEDQQRGCLGLCGAEVCQAGDPINAGATPAILQRSAQRSRHTSHEAISEGLLKRTVDQHDPPFRTVSDEAVGVPDVSANLSSSRDLSVSSRQAFGQALGAALSTPGFSVDGTVSPSDAAKKSQVLDTTVYSVSAPVDDLDRLPTEELQRAAGSDDAEDFLFFVKNRVAAIRQRERQQHRVAHRERRHKRRALLRFPKTDDATAHKRCSVENSASEQSNHGETAHTDQFTSSLAGAAATDGYRRKMEKQRQYSCRVPALTDQRNLEMGGSGESAAAKPVGSRLYSRPKHTADGGFGGKAPEEDYHSAELSSSSSCSSASDSESSGSSVSYKSNGAIVDGPINPERVWRATAAQLRSEGKDGSEIAFEMACHLTPAEARREHRRRRFQRRFVRRSDQKTPGRPTKDAFGSFPPAGSSGGGPQDELQRVVVSSDSAAVSAQKDTARATFSREKAIQPVSGRRWERRITYLFAVLQKKRDRGLLSQATFEREKRKLFDLLFEWDATQNRVALRQASRLPKATRTSHTGGQSGSIKVFDSVGPRRGMISRSKRLEHLRPGYESNKQGPGLCSTRRTGAYSGRLGRNKSCTQLDEESSLDLTEEIQREFFHQDLQCFALDITTDGTDDDPTSSAFGDSEQAWPTSTAQGGYSTDERIEQPLGPSLAETASKRPSPLGSVVAARQLGRAATMDLASGKDRTNDKSGRATEEGVVATRKLGVSGSPGVAHTRSQPRWWSQGCGSSAPQQQSVSQGSAAFLSPWAARVVKRKEEERKRKRNFERRQMLMRRFDQRAAPEHRMFKQDTSVLRPGLSNTGSLSSFGIQQGLATGSVEAGEACCQAPIPVWLLEATRCREHRLLIFPEDIRKL